MKTQEIATKQTLALANEQKTILMKFKGLEKIVNSLDEVF